MIQLSWEPEVITGMADFVTSEGDYSSEEGGVGHGFVR